MFNLFDNVSNNINAPANLLKSVVVGDLKMATEAIEAGVDVNELPSDASESPYVLIAAREKHWDIVNLLLDNGASPNARNRMRWNLLNQLIKNDSPIDLIEKVMNLGARLTDRDNFGDTPFMTAVKANNFKLVDYLTAIPEIDRLSPDKQRKTALHQCAILELKDMFIKLCSEGLDVSAVDIENKTATDYIKDKEWLEELVKIEKSSSLTSKNTKIFDNSKKEVESVNSTNLEKGNNEELKEKIQEVRVEESKVTGISSIKKKKIS